MDKCFKEVTRIPICLEHGKKYQVEIQGNEVVISKEVGWETVWENVTKSCYLEFRDSRHCNGRYIAIMYGMIDPTPVAIVGMQGIHTQSGFKIEKATGAYTSFKILMKTRKRG